MAQAAILSPEAFRDAQRRAEVRQRLHNRIDAWLDKLEARVKDPTFTLEELTQAVFALRQELTQAVTEGLVEQVHRAVVEPAYGGVSPVWTNLVGARPPGSHDGDAGGGDPAPAPVLLL
jgi:hypothetical protein